jgi:hypothetical protein
MFFYYHNLHFLSGFIFDPFDFGHLSKRIFIIKPFILLCLEDAGRV